jgi:hypothetical protein
VYSISARGAAELAGLGEYYTGLPRRPADRRVPKTVYHAPATARAQAVYGSIFGTITDQSGAAVVGAKLTVTSVQKHIRFATTSNRAGNYSVTHLIPDLYDVQRKPGSKNLSRDA